MAEIKKAPKVAIVSDGECTGVLLDGVFIGQGISRLNFSIENKDGEIRSMIRVMDLDLRYVSMQRDADSFWKFCNRISE